MRLRLHLPEHSNSLYPFLPETGGAGEGGDGTGGPPAATGEPKVDPPAEVDHKAEAEKWKAQSQKQEARAKANADAAAELAKLKAANQSDTEKAISEATAAARATAEAEAAAKYAAPLVKAEFKALLAGRDLTDARVKTLVEHLAATAYLKDGEVDTATLTAYADAVAPKQTGSNLDFGQGQRQSPSTTVGANGAAEAARRFPKPA